MFLNVVFVLVKMDGTVASVSKKILIGDGTPSGWDNDNGSINEGNVGSDDKHGIATAVTLM